MYLLFDLVPPNACSPNSLLINEVQVFDNYRIRSGSMNFLEENSNDNVTQQVSTRNSFILTKLLGIMQICMTIFQKIFCLV